MLLRRLYAHIFIMECVVYLLVVEGSFYVSSQGVIILVIELLEAGVTTRDKYCWTALSGEIK